MASIPGFVQNTLRLAGVYQQQTLFQNTYHVTTAAAGVVLATSASTTQTFGLWNPAGNLFVAVPIACRVSYVSGTMTAAGLCYSTGTALGSVVAGTSAVTAMTSLTLGNGRIGKGVNSNMKPGSSFTLGTAPVIYRQFGAGWGAPIATTAAFAPMYVDVFDGDVSIEPGSALFLCGDAAVGGSFAVSLSWIEVPIAGLP
jgi:hypothetical protein